MKEFALIQLDPLEFVRFVDSEVRTKPGFSIVPVIVEVQPDFDGGTQAIERVRTVSDQSVTEGWQVTDLTKDEIKQIAFLNAIDAGYDTGLGYKLSLTPESKSEFVGLLTLLATAGVPDEAPVEISDMEGVKRSLTVGDLKSLLVQYGFYYQSIWSASK